MEDTTRSGATDTEDDDDIDLFGSEEEEVQHEWKQATNPALAAKSFPSLDGKPRGRPVRGGRQERSGGRLGLGLF